MSANEPLLSVCLIVKNEEKNLSLTLPPLAAGADEVIVVDTGSGDHSAELARRLGARVYSYNWADDFSAARNFSIAKARGKWIIWVDADEYLKPEDLQSLREILKNSDEPAYEVRVEECHYGALAGGSYYWRVKIFRNFRGIHFERPINEQVYDRNGRPQTGSRLDLSVHHWGNREALEPEKFIQKKQRNIEALKKALETNPRDPLFNYLMGINLKEIGELYQAAAYFKEAGQLSTEPGWRYEALILRAWCFFGLRLFNEALAEAESAARIVPDRPEALIVKASVFNVQKRFAETVALLTSTQFKITEAGVLSVNLNYYGYLPNFILAEAHLMLGNLRPALEAYKKAYRFKPEPTLVHKMTVIEQLLEAGIEYHPAAFLTPVEETVNR